MKRILVFQAIAISILGLFLLALLRNFDNPFPRSLTPVLAFDQSTPLPTRTPLPTLIPSQTPTLQAVFSYEIPIATATVAVPTATAHPTNPAPEDWKEWPVFPAYISDAMRDVYQRGLQKGNNMRAFSILGDCQSLPEVFMGVYDSDPFIINRLPFEQRVTVRQFRGSFDRYSPTVKDGSTEGSMLWAPWNDNEDGKCDPKETPLDCELRVHRPSIAFIHVGTHWEARNEHYLTLIIEKLLENGTVPVVVTKADNREFDERVNRNLISLADRYDLPVWNFWASVQDLPNHGMQAGSTMYLSDEGAIVHRRDALKMLDQVWRAVRE